MNTEFLLYCRAGYEVDVLNEVEHLLSQKGAYGFGNVVKHKGYMRYQALSDITFENNIPSFINNGSLKALSNTYSRIPSLNKLIFARQKLMLIGELSFEDLRDRVGAVLQFVRSFADTNDLNDACFGDVLCDYPDTEAGKPLAPFCKKFTVPLRNALRQAAYMSRKPNKTLPYLHLFFEQGDKCLIAISMPGDRSEHSLGIQRLKLPAKAPSRSTLKLEEAINTFCSRQQQTVLFQQGMTAVDLGACPGGWTYQLVIRHIHVEAVDNGKMDADLLDTGLVDYAAADGFSYRPKQGHVDWLVCDMIEQPDKVAKLMLKWLKNGYCSAAIFNLKLPMKKRYVALRPILDEFERFCQDLEHIAVLRAKHLYHNRDEVTFMIIKSSVMCREFEGLQ